jgi:hypothetical protein
MPHTPARRTDITDRATSITEFSSALGHGPTGATVMVGADIASSVTVAAGITEVMAADSIAVAVFMGAVVLAEAVAFTAVVILAVAAFTVAVDTSVAAVDMPAVVASTVAAVDTQAVVAADMPVAVVDTAAVAVTAKSTCIRNESGEAQQLRRFSLLHFSDDSSLAFAKQA